MVQLDPRILVSWNLKMTKARIFVSIYVWNVERFLKLKISRIENEGKDEYKNDLGYLERKKNPCVRDR